MADAFGLPEFKNTYTDEFGNEFTEEEHQRIFWANSPIQEYNKMLRERLDAQEHSEPAPTILGAPVVVGPAL